MEWACLSGCAIRFWFMQHPRAGHCCSELALPSLYHTSHAEGPSPIAEFASSEPHLLTVCSDIVDRQLHMTPAIHKVHMGIGGNPLMFPHIHPVDHKRGTVW